MTQGTRMESFMFGGFTPPASQNGDQLVGAVATSAIKALFQKVERLEAQVKAFPVTKLLMGSLDGFDLLGEGLLMRNGLRIQRMQMQVQPISLDFGAIFSGKIRLRQPTSAALKVVLTEKDLTDSFNTPFITSKLQLVKIDDQALQFKETCTRLLEGGLWQLTSQIAMGNQPFEAVSITCRIQCEGGRRLLLIDPVFEGTPQAQHIGQQVIEHINGLMDLDKFSLDGVSLRIYRCEIRPGQLMFHGATEIKHFPGAR